MAVMPGAAWRPLPNASATRMAAHDIVCLHTMVGSLAGTDAYFRRITSGVNSHFGTGGDGTIYQWVDTAVRSGANYNGNHHIISVENADMGAEFPPWNTGDGAAVPPFTDEQIEANARICAWAHLAYGVPLELIPDSKPGRRGIGYHRLGVPGYMVAGGEQWSSSRGKVCPADRRVAQIPQIIARARQIAAGDTGTPLLSMESDMQLVKTPDNKVYKVTDLDVSHEPNPYRLNALAKARGLTAADIVPVSYAELQDNAGDAAERRTRLLGGVDVDEQAIVAGLLPQITEALAGRTGATREEIAELLRGITLRAS